MTKSITIKQLAEFRAGVSAMEGELSTLCTFLNKNFETLNGTLDNAFIYLETANVIKRTLLILALSEGATLFENKGDLSDKFEEAVIDPRIDIANFYRALLQAKYLCAQRAVDVADSILTFPKGMDKALACLNLPPLPAFTGHYDEDALLFKTAMTEALEQGMQTGKDNFDPESYILEGVYL